MSDVLEKLVGSLVARSDATGAQIEKDNLNLETVEIICGNLKGHLSQAIEKSSSKDTIEEKYETLQTSVHIIQQALVNEPQKVKNQQWELRIRQGVYNEVLELMKALTAELEPPINPELIPITEPGSLTAVGELPPEVKATLGSLLKDE